MTKLSVQTIRATSAKFERKLDAMRQRHYKRETAVENAFRDHTVATLKKIKAMPCKTHVDIDLRDRLATEAFWSAGYFGVKAEKLLDQINEQNDRVLQHLDAKAGVVFTRGKKKSKGGRGR